MDLYKRFYDPVEQHFKNPKNISMSRRIFVELSLQSLREGTIEEKVKK